MCSEIGWHKWAARHWISWTWGDITALQRSTHNVIGDKGWVLYFSRLTSWSECPGQLDGSSDTCGRCPVMGNLSRAPVIGSCRAQHLLAHGHSTAMVVHGCGSIASTVGDTQQALWETLRHTLPNEAMATVDLTLCKIQLRWMKWHWGPRHGLPSDLGSIVLWNS